MSTDNILQGASNVVAVAIGIFLGLAVADFPGFEAWLSQWQTLLAGILAIVAAGLTIIQMERTDARQQLRHEQLTGLTLRADRLRIQRATTPYAKIARDRAATAGELLERLQPLTARDFLPVSDQANGLFSWATDIVSLMDSLAEAANLFEPDLAYARQYTMTHIGNFNEALESIQASSLRMDLGGFNRDKAVLLGTIQIVRMTLPAIADGLERTWEQYR